jgi:hypothetical protein
MAKNKIEKLPKRGRKMDAKKERPSPLVVYLISMFIAFIVLVPAAITIFFFFDLDFFKLQNHENVIESALLTGFGLSIVVGAVFGFFANKQILDMKE